MAKNTKLVVFQGNPGLRYRKTRHNIGFFVADHLADLHGLKFKYHKRFNAEIAEWEEVLLVKPKTFYNKTGLSVRAIIDFYKINHQNDLLVVCDDLNLPFGTLRIREKGSDGGNNGLKSIIKTAGSNFARLRIGTANNKRARMSDRSFVLAKLSRNEQEDISEIIEDAVNMINDFLLGGSSRTIKVISKKRS